MLSELIALNDSPVILYSNLNFHLTLLVLTLVVNEITPFMILFWFTDDIKRLPSIEQAVWHKDSKYNLMVLLCSNGNKSIVQ